MPAGWNTGDTADVSLFRGFVFPYAGSSPPAGWLLCDGSAVSRTTYAALFALIGTTYGAGDGSTTFNVPDLRGSMIIGAGQRVRTMSFDGASAVDPSNDEIAVTSNDWLHTGQAVVLSGSSLPTGLSAGTYYVIRTSATVIKLATSLANAQNSVAVDITGDGVGACVLTQTLSSRTLGATGGEEAHAMSINELLAHDHPNVRVAGTAGGNGGSSHSDGSTGSRGGNQAMNVMSPYTALNFVIKT